MAPKSSFATTAFGSIRRSPKTQFLSTYCIGLALAYLKTLLPNLGRSEDQTSPPIDLGFFPWRNYPTFWIISQYLLSYNRTENAVRLEQAAVKPARPSGGKPYQVMGAVKRRALRAAALRPKKRTRATQKQERIGGGFRNNLSHLG